MRALHPLSFIPTVQCEFSRRLFLCCIKGTLSRVHSCILALKNRSNLSLCLSLSMHHDSGYGKDRCDDHSDAAALTLDTKQVLNETEAQLLLAFCRSCIKGADCLLLIIGWYGKWLCLIIKIVAVCTLSLFTKWTNTPSHLKIFSLGPDVFSFNHRAQV